MHKRHTLHGSVSRTARPTSSIPGESATRLRRSIPSVEDNIQASIEFAMAELDALEVPYTASAPPLAAEPAQQMPRGMPPLPFHAPHPGNMPPLPARLQARSSLPAAPGAAELSAAAPLESTGDASAPPSRWLLFVALALGIVCLGLAFWLRAR
jgi:hypothetical protein